MQSSNRFIGEIECDAIVIGGGAAGIAAAQVFQRSGFKRVILLEARERLGGRAHSSDELGCGVSLDHGAQWIHGFKLSHPMVELADNLHKKSGPMSGGLGVTLLSDGQDVPPNMIKKARKQFQRLGRQVALSVAKLLEEDCTWTEAIERTGGLPRLSPEDNAVLNLQVYNSCENYEGARLDCWSARNWNQATCIEGGNGDVDGGYGNLLVEAGRDLQVQFGRRVKSVRYPTQCDLENGIGFVHVHCLTTCCGDDFEETYCAPRCVVTLPLGVLQAGYVRFEPELPTSQIQAIRALGTALMDKVELLWHNRWWPSHINSFQIASLDSSPTFHPWPWFFEPAPTRRHPLGWGILVCYITGHFAKHVESLPDDEAVAHCITALRSAFPAEEVPHPAEAHITRWCQDEFACGSWTYYAVGSGPSNVHSLREPIGVNGCVALAGEHTCDGSVWGLDMGTVHGAWLSGELAANGLMERTRRVAGDVAARHSLGYPAGGMEGRGGGGRQCDALGDNGRQDMAVHATAENQARWRCQYRHCIDEVVPTIEGYGREVRVEVTGNPNEIAEEFYVDPDESHNIAIAQQYCGKRGRITERSRWGWLRVEFDDGSPSCWWTPYCLWVVARC